MAPPCVVDCGNGVFGKLREHIDYTDVDAVAITHMHADHFFDLFPFAYGLLLTPRQQPVPVAGWPGTEEPARPRLIAPVGAAATLRSISSAWGDEALVESAFRLEEYKGSEPVAVGPFELRFAEVPHYILTFAIEVRTEDGKRVTFGADCSPNDAIVEFARDTDLLVIEATLPRPERTGIRGHLTPSEAGEHAQPREREGRAADPRLRRARPGMGRGRGRAWLRRPRRGRRRRGHVRGLIAPIA